MQLESQKLDVATFHNESWKPIYCGFKGQGYESQKNVTGVGLCTLVSAGVF